MTRQVQPRALLRSRALLRPLAPLRSLVPSRPRDQSREGGSPPLPRRSVGKEPTSGPRVRELSAAARRLREGLICAALSCGMLAAGLVMFHIMNALGP
ncbi:hypothetical protein J2S53_002950 [Actinopolyspora lacussalsi]|nr:hypothetical protein [Actinopolyspora lacussalsi]